MKIVVKFDAYQVQVPSTYMLQLLYVHVNCTMPLKELLYMFEFDVYQVISTNMLKLVYVYVNCTPWLE